MNKIINALDYDHYPVEFKEYMNEESEIVKKYIAGINNILEVGFGVGRNIAEIAPLVEKYYGIEIDKKAFKVAKQKFQPFSNVDIELMNATKLSKKFSKNYFDKAICLFNTIGCSSNPNEILKNMAFVSRESFLITLQRKGTLSDRIKYYENLNIPYTVDYITETIISEAWGESHSYSPEEIKKIATNLDLEIIEMKNIGKLAICVIFEKVLRN